MYKYTDIYIYIYMYTYIYMCVHVYIYICIHTHTYIYIYTHTQIYLFIYIYTYLHIYIHTYVYIYIHMYVYIHTFIYIYIYIYTYLYIHIHMYIYTHIYIYTCVELSWHLSPTSKWFCPLIPLSTAQTFAADCESIFVHNFSQAFQFEAQLRVSRLRPKNAVGPKNNRYSKIPYIFSWWFTFLSVLGMIKKMKISAAKYGEW